MAFWFSVSLPEFTFESGQNVDLTIDELPESAPGGRKRTFSFASSPQHRGRFMIATRMRPSVFKNTLRSMPIGSSLSAVGPNGNMVLHDDASRPAVMIAGGIGITPFRSMIEDAVLQHRPHRLTLLYSNRTKVQTAFLDELEAWAKAGRLTLIPTLTDEPAGDWPYERGKIDEAFVRHHVPDRSTALFYLAGPDPMVMALRRLVLGLGVSRDQLRLEGFSGY